MNEELVYNTNPLLVFAVVFLAAVIFGIIVRFVFFKTINHYTNTSDEAFVHSLSKRFSNSIFLFIPLGILKIFLNTYFPEDYPVFDKIIGILIVISLSIVISKVIYVIQDVLFEQYDISDVDNVKARKAVTQITFLRKIGIVIIALISLGVILLSFESVRKYGATLLTSAGVAGIIIGFAAQKTLANLLAGIQIAFTQPIKIDDAVVVEGEWGWVEEINLTYAVVRIWDKRRLVLPITYFTETPFQNWTRSKAQILGSVFIYLDYTAPLAPLRTHFDKLLKETPLWDGEAKAFQVTDTTERTMKIRLLMTARNSPEAFDLRCFIREGLIDYIQKEFPDSLPKTRAVLNDPIENSR